MNTEPILIVDDDSDDKDFIQDAWKELNYQNQLLFFKSGEEVLHFLEAEKTVPFLILSDVNLPKMDGFELKDKLLKHPYTRYKSIPFVFWSTAISNAQLQKAYDLGVNGIFLKEHSFGGLKQSLIDIVNYWAKSKVPE
ncbi:MAG: response regulator receiver protein [Segetibacter sp.]|nr:response regulator receiver protein [Segetibacter sp.]